MVKSEDFVFSVGKYKAVRLGFLEDSTSIYDFPGLPSSYDWDPQPHQGF